MARPERETARMLLELLETVRELRPYFQRSAGKLHLVKVLLRKAGVPISRPRKGD